MDLIPTRDGFGTELVALGKERQDIVVVSADLEDATRAEFFKKEFPGRFFSVGIAEQDMVGTAGGLALEGYVVFASSFAVFMTNRAYDMIRIDVCQNNANVKIVCSHAGITVGEDGATVQCLEDIAIMRVLPNMIVLCPVDTIEVKKATRWMANYYGPVYMRTSRCPVPVITNESDPFVMGKASIMREGKDGTIIACGLIVWESLQAAEILQKEGIEARVVNMHTIKPIDEQMILESAKKTRAVVTAEEHQLMGGLGSAVCEVLAQRFPVPVEMIGMKDAYGESGDPQGLLKKHHMKDVDIAEAVKRAIKRKA
ncbi:MAG: transketolase family protein [Candidatus Omnitrophica bacterium]|nr:transketolase family protein [Candidatus Omnitrophota bacterium]